jgi:crossover junction endodeoxyribonuclease RusA
VEGPHYRRKPVDFVRRPLSIGKSRCGHALFYFPDTEMVGDIDNIVKPVLDALGKHIYMDDRQVHRVLVQKFEPRNVFPFESPSSTLKDALNRTGPILYIRLSDNPFEDLK